MTELGAVLLVICVLALMVGVIWLIYATRNFRLQCRNERYKAKYEKQSMFEDGLNEK